MVNRRQFLAGAATVLASAAAGCTGLKAPALPAPATPHDPPVSAEGPRPFRVVLLSDPHIEAADSSLAVATNGKLRKALADYKSLRPDLFIVNGDIANAGQAAQLDAFGQIMAAAAKPDRVMVNTGNHDFYDKTASDEEELRRFRTAFGLSTAYSHRVAGGLHFVMLADERYKTAPRCPEWAWLTPEQLRWFEKVLSENRSTPTAVFLHQPLQDTVVWTFGGNDFAGCGQSAELRALLKRNPQVRLWFSGHTHMGAEVPGNTVKQNGVSFVGLGSTFYQFVQAAGPAGAEYGGFRKDLSVSQSRLLEVGPDRLVLRVRDHVAQTWLDDYRLELPRPDL